MSEKAKSFGAGSIVTALSIFIITGVFGWVGLETTKVPQLRASIESLNDAYSEIVSIAKRTEVIEKKIDWMYRTMKVRIDESSKMCREHERRIIKIETEIERLINKK